MGELSPDLLDLDLDRKDSLYVKEDPKEAGMYINIQIWI